MDARHRVNALYDDIDLARAKLDGALLALPGDDLRAMTRLLPMAKPYPTRKADMATAILGHLAGERLREVWEDLDETQRLAVAEALYDDDRRFRQDRFRAKYGKLPKGFNDVGYRQSSPLRLFLYPVTPRGGVPAVVPVDLAKRLKAFVPEPAEVEIASTTELPATVRQARRGYFRSERERPFDFVELQGRDGEQSALREVLTLLRLVDTNAVSVSAATRRPTSASVKRIADVLEGGDFFDVHEKKARSWEQVPGPVRAHAWPLLLQAGKLAALRGSKLALTKAGRAALAAPPADTLKDLWDRWISNPLFDEFNRIDDIKGQTRGRGKKALTAAGDRRDVIDEALGRCPVDRWVAFDEFARFMRASSLEFEVTTDPWTLYLGEPRYGSLGFGGNHDWILVQGRYVLCVLFEYAATLGLLDIAYTRPENARLDFTEMSGADAVFYLSRYDGLRYFRVNPLGAYCLGSTDSYTPSRPEVRAKLSVYPDRRVQRVGGTLGQDEILLLETYANRESTDVWRLDGSRIVLAVEAGRDIGELREFIAGRDEQELPELVDGFLRQTERAARALAPRGSAAMFECAGAETLARLTEDKSVRGLCLPAGERHLVVPEKSVAAFRKAVHRMGLGISAREEVPVFGARVVD